jgi:hypothetical protein
MTQTQSRSPAPTVSAQDETGGDVSAAIERALAVARGLLSDELRRAELAVVRESLKRIEDGDHPESDGGAAGPGGRS